MHRLVIEFAGDFYSVQNISKEYTRFSSSIYFLVNALIVQSITRASLIRLKDACLAYSLMSF